MKNFKQNILLYRIISVSNFMVFLMNLPCIAIQRLPNLSQVFSTSILDVLQQLSKAHNHLTFSISGQSLVSISQG